MTKTNTETSSNKYDSLELPNILVTEENNFNYGYMIPSTSEAATIARRYLINKIPTESTYTNKFVNIAALFKYLIGKENQIIGFDSLEEAYAILPKTVDKSKIIDYTKETL